MNESDRHAIGIDQPGIGGVDPRTLCKPQGQHLALGHRALILNARELADRELSIVVENAAFGTQPAREVPRPLR